MKITAEMVGTFYQTYMETENEPGPLRTDVRAGLEAVAPMILNAYHQAALEIQGQLLETGVNQTWYQALQLVAAARPTYAAVNDLWVYEAARVYKILQAGPPS